MRPSRSEQIRRRDRKVFAWSLALAAAVHLALFVLHPGFRSALLTPSEVRVESGEGGSGRVVFVDLLFGPPAITAPDGTVHHEPPGRFLEADRLVPLPPDCADLVETGDVLPLRGTVRLIVGGSGRASVAQIVEGTGHACTDQVVRQVAEALRYHWLPNERYPNPVDLVQPVTVIRAEEG